MNDINGYIPSKLYKMYSSSSHESSYETPPRAWMRPAEFNLPDVIGILKLDNAANGDSQSIHT